MRVSVRHDLAAEPVRAGESVAVRGCCLTALEPDDTVFAADLSPETVSRTGGADSWARGRPVNLERSLRAADRLGGHVVLGHVDGQARVVAHRRCEDGSSVLRVELPSEGSEYVVEKGSIALDGVSLTISDLDETWFEIALIPATLSATTLGGLVPGDRVNVEYDVLAKYAAHAARRHLASSGRQG